MNQQKDFKLIGLLLLLVLVGMLPACAPGSGGTKGGKSCLDCHAEYKQLYSQGVVHKPVKSGDCAGCHRKHGLIGGVYLKLEEPALCFSCHQDLAVFLGENRVHHPPVGKGECAACHQPHNAPEKNLLGQPQAQLCYQCHEQAGFTRKYVHQPLEDGCQTCHETHGAKVGKLLRKEESALCQDCHNIKQQPFVAAHGAYPVDRGCADCHSVHSADNQALLKNFTHQPIADRSCSACHAAADSAEPFAVSERSSALCYRCHTQQQRDFEHDKTHSPVRDGDCFACHSPHASEYVGIAKTDPQLLCLECHSFNYFGSSAQQVGKGAVHTPAASGDCLSCHAPHLAAKGQPALLRKAGNQLCADCHAEKLESQPVAHQPAAAGHCLACHAPHESAQRGVLKKQQRPLCGECHQLVGEHLGLPNLHRPFVAGNCSACHDPHGGKLRKLLVDTGASACGKCHGTIETERQTARHQPFKEGRCELCHESHGSVLPFLLAKDARDLCVDCHTARRPPQATPGGHQNCSVCHHAHGNDEKSYLLREQPALCLSCHNIDQYWANGVGHLPAVEGRCDACHDSHAPQLSKAKNADASVCTDCHDVSAETLAASHQGIAPGKASCLGCHDPHGGPDASLTLPVKHAPFTDGDCTSCHDGERK